MSEWQPIETAPHPDDESHAPQILGWSESEGHDVVWCGWHENGKPVWFNGDVRWYPTHWMPLPKPPE